jgi:hypothetical protein
MTSLPAAWRRSRRSATKPPLSWPLRPAKPSAPIPPGAPPPTIGDATPPAEPVPRAKPADATLTATHLRGGGTDAPDSQTLAATDTLRRSREKVPLIPRLRRRPRPRIIVVAVAILVAATASITGYLLTGPSSGSSSQSSSQSPSQSSRQIILPFTRLAAPEGLAVNTVGDVYVADHGNNQVMKLAAGSSTPITMPFIGLKGPSVWRSMPRATSTLSTFLQTPECRSWRRGRVPRRCSPFTGLNHPYGVAVDTAGSVYVTDRNTNRVLKLPPG